MCFVCMFVLFLFLPIPFEDICREKKLICICTLKGQIFDQVIKIFSIDLLPAKRSQETKCLEHVGSAYLGMKYLSFADIY